jgi:aminopeptidase N
MYQPQRVLPSTLIAALGFIATACLSNSSPPDINAGNAVAQASTRGQAGSPSLNDPIYPWMGNGGYDAQHYSIDLRIPADHKTMIGSTTMEAIAVQDLSRFNLDLGTPTVDYVLVNGARATFEHADPELTITPAAPITKGSDFRVQVGYRGIPGSTVQVDPSGGWKTTPTGLSVLAQPSALMNWAAVNDHPADKASYSFRLTAPQSEQAIANGVFLNRRENNNGTATSFYRIAEPTTSYMPMLAVGPFKLIEGGTVEGVRIRHYLLPNMAAYYRPALEKTGDMLRFFSQRLGKYPFREYGILTHDLTAGLALENQTLSSFATDFDLPKDMPEQEKSDIIEEVAGHELAHQWFGAMVTHADHSQMFLHEGFAEFLGRFWRDYSTDRKLTQGTTEDYPSLVFARQGGYNEFTRDELLDFIKNDLELDPATRFNAEQTGKALDLLFVAKTPSAARARMVERARKSGPGLNIAQFFEEIGRLPFTRVAISGLAIHDFIQLTDPNLEPFKPSPVPGTIKFGDDPLDDNVYARGSATLHALYLKVGEARFFNILRTFLNRHRFATATNQDFLRVVGELGGAEARRLTERWLFDARVPDFPELGLKPGAFKLGADFKP